MRTMLSGILVVLALMPAYADEPPKAIAARVEIHAIPPCVQQDPHVNHDAEATAAAKIAVKEFLRATFRIE